MNNTDLFSSKEYKRSRNAYRFECAFEYLVSLLVTDAFLAKILKSIGFSDEATGVISSFISLAFLFQLFSVFVIQKITNTKVFAIVFHSASQIFFMSLYLIPFLPIGESVKQPLTVAAIIIAYFGNYFVSAMIYRWGNSYVEPTVRGRYSAGKEIMSLAVGMVFSLAVGYIMDAFDKSGNEEHGFIFAAILILVLCISDFITLLLIKNEIKPKSETKKPLPLRDIAKNTVGNRNFRSVIILAIIWEAGRYFTLGFLGTYKLIDLGYTIAAVQVINIVSNLARAVFSIPFGKLSDKRSFAKAVEVGLMVGFASFFSGIFATPEARFFIIIHTVLYNIALAGVFGNLVNITYSYVDSKYFAEASAIKNSISGLIGFLASLVAGKILAAIQANGNTLFGIPVYGQQVLCAISSILFIIAIIYTRAVIEKQDVMVQ